MCTSVRRPLIAPVTPSKSKASTKPVPLSLRYIVPPSGLQPMPLEIVNPVSTVLQRPSSSRRYSVPAPGDSSYAIVPAQKRPCGSHAPSFMRTLS